MLAHRGPALLELPLFESLCLLHKSDQRLPDVDHFTRGTV